MAKIIQSPRNPDPPPKIQEPDGEPTNDDWRDHDYPDPDYVEDLEVEVAELIAQLKTEIGLRWCSLPLRLQIEKIELLLGRAGTVRTG